MHYRRLGSSGLVVSEIGLGTVLLGRHVDEPMARELIGTALDLGVTFIDTSDSYGDGASERLIGKILGPRRRDIALATKFSSPMGDDPLRRGTSRRWIHLAVDESLQRLGTDVIDLYQIHHPDPLTPIEETLRALDDLVRMGKVRYIGYSNVAAWQLVDGQWTARTHGLARPVSSTNHLNLAHRTGAGDLLAAARAHGVGIIPYYPFESGLLTGRYRAGGPVDGLRLPQSPRGASLLSPGNFARLERWEAFAAERGRTLIELALGWLLSHQEVGSVIAGATSAGQVRSTVASAAWRLSAEELAAIEALP